MTAGAFGNRSHRLFYCKKRKEENNMIVIVKSTARPQEVEQLKKEFEAMGLQIHLSQGANTTLMGLVGDTTCVDIGKVASMDIVERVQRIQEPYKKANRKFHP